MSDKKKLLLSTELYGLYLFLSYSHSDRIHAEQLRQTLEERSAKVWQDVTGIDVGMRIGDQLRDALHTCHATLALISKASLQSSWVMFEMGATWFAGKRLFPICVDIEPTSLPDLFRDHLACHIKEGNSRLISSLCRLVDEIVWDDNALPVSLDAITSSAITKAGVRDTGTLALALRESLSPEIKVRRHGHDIIRNETELREPFLKAVLELTTHKDDRIRAEAHYCCGEIRLPDRSFIRGEDFFSKALTDDDSPFVKASCAQVLKNFTPLSQDTVKRLEQCKIFARKADRNDYSELMFRIYATLHDNHKLAS